MPSEILTASNIVVRGKLEAAYNDGSTDPSADDNILDVFDLKYQRDAGTQNPVMGYDAQFGHPGSYQGESHSTLSFSSYLYAAATGADVPNIDGLLQAASMAVTVAADSRTYNPIQHQAKSMAFHLALRDKLHKMTGARCSTSISGAIGEAAKIACNFIGLKGALPEATAFPSVEKPEPPCAMLSDNTAFTLGGAALDLVSFTLDCGQDIKYLNTSNRKEAVQMGRAPVLNVTVLEPPLSVIDLHALADIGCNDPAGLNLGKITIPGWEISFSAGRVGVIDEGGDQDGAATVTFPIQLQRNIGNDDFILKSVGVA